MAPVKVAGGIRGTADKLWKGSNIIWRAGAGNKREENPLEQEGLQQEQHQAGRDLQGLQPWLGELFLFQQLCSDTRESPQHF